MARFPSVFEPAAVTLSVVVPAYNEEERMPPGVDEMLGHLKKMEKSPFWCVCRRGGARAAGRAVPRAAAASHAPPPHPSAPAQPPVRRVAARRPTAARAAVPALHVGDPHRQRRLQGHDRHGGDGLRAARGPRARAAAQPVQEQRQGRRGAQGRPARARAVCAHGGRRRRHALRGRGHAAGRGGARGGAQRRGRRHRLARARRGRRGQGQALAAAPGAHVGLPHVHEPHGGRGGHQGHAVRLQALHAPLGAQAV